MKMACGQKLHRIQRWLTDERDPKHLRSIMASVSTGATYLGAVVFFRDVGCDQSGDIPWLGVILLVGGLAGTFTEIALYAERAAHGDKVGKWIALISILVFLGLFLFSVLFFLGLSCPKR